jgi:hypothetical protein
MALRTNWLTGNWLATQCSIFVRQLADRRPCEAQLGTRERLAYDVLLYSAQRVGDVIRRGNLFKRLAQPGRQWPI